MAPEQRPDDDRWRDDLEASLPVVDDRTARALGVASSWVGGAVTGVGLGAEPDGTPCLVVHVDAGQPAPDLPDTVEGLPVRVVRGGAFHVQTDETRTDDAPS
ncbi:hypothetical protein [Aquipuribacter sp. MA13-6]|uniref:hypothetical protein n=1 Tax=unclassified Aquipuribacter TaxID=2635084 RepID=UPI003EECAAB2